ncbi:type II secretion system GspH family protein [Methylobacillus arboreus]|uniref:type II secretion system protein n=1 Tax=Methylobacillus arboreus TaxID=755170 RepID=UPI001E517EC7|nr:type II secretion system protein [Methylobacillus arboreus]MCB5190086.1 type II secretion system GspH family protein [Methylobacillus arboreus]
MHREHGFSLIEMAVVLVILGFVITALILPVTAQREASSLRQTENQLAIAQKALIGFAQANGRLPCPATFASRGVEAFIQQASEGGGECDPNAQLLPAATLGIQPVNDQGQAVDGWSTSVFYKVAQSNRGGSALPDFTTRNEMSLVGMALLVPEIRVCASSSDCSETSYLINNAVAVVYSLGSTGPQVLAGAAPGGADEQVNLNNDNIFVSHDIRASDPNGSFNHIVTWISPYVLYNAMVQAGQLP